MSASILKAESFWITCVFITQHFFGAVVFVHQHVHVQIEWKYCSTLHVVLRSVLVRSLDVGRLSE